MNYTDIIFLDKRGMEVPLKYESLYTLKVKNQISPANDAIAYAVTNPSGNVDEIRFKTHGSRFVLSGHYEEEVILPYTVYLIAETNEYAMSGISVLFSKIKASAENEYSVTSIATEEIESTLKSLLSIEKLLFPSVTFEGAVHFDLVSTDLHETQSLHMFTKKEDKLAEIEEWPAEYDLFFFIDQRKQKDFRLFEVKPGEDEFKWTDRIFALPTEKKRVNISFSSVEEGYFEDYLNVCLIDNTNKEEGEEYGDIHFVGKFKLCAETEGEDERFRDLFANYGIPDPKTYNSVFADSDPIEGKDDMRKLNKHSKLMWLNYTDIFSYIGTYKALLNAIKALGYSDVFFKEWYRRIGASKAEASNILCDIAYGNTSINTINAIPIEERIHLKKLNWLSVIFEINKESRAPLNDFGFPLIETVYGFNNTEWYAKLISLKKWLEKYILGLNCHIIDVSGEAIVFERYTSNKWGTYRTNYGIESIMPLGGTIKAGPIDLETGLGEIGVRITSAENGMATLESLSNYSLRDFIDGSLSETGDASRDITSEVLEEKESQLNENPDAWIFFGGTFDHLDTSNTYTVRTTAKPETFMFGDIIDSDTCQLLIRDGRIAFNTPEAYSKQFNSKFDVLPIIYIDKANLVEKNGKVHRIEAESSQDYITLIPRYDTTKDSMSAYEEGGIEYDTRTVGLRYSSVVLNSSLVNPRFWLWKYKFSYVLESWGIDPEAVWAASNELGLEIFAGKMFFQIGGEHPRTVMLKFNTDAKTQITTIEVQVIYEGTEQYIEVYKDTNEVYYFSDGGSYPTFVNSYRDEPEECIKYNTEAATKVLNSGTYSAEIMARNEYGDLFVKKASGEAEVTREKPNVITYAADNIIVGESEQRGNIQPFDDCDEYCIYETMPKYSLNHIKTSNNDYERAVKSKEEIQYTISSGIQIDPVVMSTRQVGLMNVSERFDILSASFSSDAFEAKLVRKSENGPMSFFKSTTGGEMNVQVVFFDELLQMPVVQAPCILKLDGNYTLNGDLSIFPDGDVNKYFTNVHMSLYLLPITPIKIANCLGHLGGMEYYITLTEDSPVAQMKYGNVGKLIFERSIGEISQTAVNIANDPMNIRIVFKYPQANFIDSVFKKMKVEYAYAHEAFVDYETKSGLISIGTNGSLQTVIKQQLLPADCETLQYVDGTFVASPRKFSFAPARNMWMSYNERKKYCESDSLIFVGKNTGVSAGRCSVVFEAEETLSPKEFYCWRVYGNGGYGYREMLYEVFNTRLPLEVSDIGSYDVELTTYDINGNMSSRTISSAMTVKGLSL